MAILPSEAKRYKVFKPSQHLHHNRHANCKQGNRDSATEKIVPRESTPEKSEPEDERAGIFNKLSAELVLDHPHMRPTPEDVAETFLPPKKRKVARCLDLADVFGKRLPPKKLKLARIPEPVDTFNKQSPERLVCNRQHKRSTPKGVAENFLLLSPKKTKACDES